MYQAKGDGHGPYYHKKRGNGSIWVSSTQRGNYIRVNYFPHSVRFNYGHSQGVRFLNSATRSGRGTRGGGRDRGRLRGCGMGVGDFILDNLWFKSGL